MHWISVTWITAVISAGAVGNITVIQSPNSLTKTPGQTARLGCTYQGPSGIGSYAWHRGSKRGNEVSNNTEEFGGRVFAASQEDFRDRRDASIRIVNLKPEDTGFYTCEVVFLGMREAYGTGTTLIVTRDFLTDNDGSSTAESKSNTSPFVFAMAAELSLLFIMVVIIIVMRCQKTGNNPNSCASTPEQPERPVPLYAEIHKGETSCVRSESRRTNQDDDGIQYTAINAQEESRCVLPVNEQTVTYAAVKKTRQKRFSDVKHRERVIEEAIPPPLPPTTTQGSRL